MYADTMSEAMKLAIDETSRRRSIQEEYNKEHNIVPKTIIKEISDVVTTIAPKKKDNKQMTKKEKQMMLEKLESEMMEAARNFDFEKAMELREIYFEIKKGL